MKDFVKTLLHYNRQTLRLAIVTSGRASRAEVLNWGASLILLDLILSRSIRSFLTGSSLNWALLAIPFVIITPSFALFVRRMHDLNRSGWWSLPVIILAAQNLLLAIVTLSAGWSARSAAEAFTRYLDWALFPTFGLAWLAMACLPGTRGSNRFGPDPRPLLAPA